jgi:threonylcarbamoyladenosine tRNA methylthiotransferase MtaB
VTTFTTAFVGCKVSQADCEAAANELAAAGLVPARADDADVAVVMTCCVTAEAERKSRRLASRLARRGTRVVVAGCASRLRPEQFRGEGIRALDEGPGGSYGGRKARSESEPQVVSSGETFGGPASLPAFIEGLAERDASAARRSGSASPPPSRTRMTLKIQDGCAQVCSYCAVRQARGTPVSVPLAGIVERARRGLAAGCGEVVLTGVDLGAYHDADGGADLAGVVGVLCELPGLRRVRLSSLEPGHLTPRLLAALAHPGVARHLHVPLQSADDRVLAAMARPYTFAGYLEALAGVTDTLGDVAFTTDVIVGFPTEDEAAFEHTLAAVRPASGLFERLHVFSYSRRPGTAAETLGTLPAVVVKERAARVRGVARDAQHAGRVRRLGQPADILLEDWRDGFWRGYSSHYVRYYLEGDGGRGELVRAVGEETFADGLRGRIV